MNQIKLFGKAGCSLCVEAKRLLDASKISYEYFDIETLEGMTEFSTVGWRDLLPVLVWGDKKPVCGAAVALRLPVWVEALVASGSSKLV